MDCSQLFTHGIQRNFVCTVTAYLIGGDLSPQLQQGSHIRAALCSPILPLSLQLQLLLLLQLSLQALQLNLELLGKPLPTGTLYPSAV